MIGRKDHICYEGRLQPLEDQYCGAGGRYRGSACDIFYVTVFLDTFGTYRGNDKECLPCPWEGGEGKQLFIGETGTSGGLPYDKFRFQKNVMCDGSVFIADGI